MQELRRARRAAAASRSAPRRASSGGDRAERRGQDDAAADPRRRARADAGRVSLDRRDGRLGPAAAGDLLEALRGGEPAPVRPAGEGRRRRGRGRPDARPDGPARPGRRPGRDALGRQPAAGQHRRRAARRSRRCCCSTSRRVARPAPARAAVGVRRPRSRATTARPSCTPRTTSPRPSGTPTGCWSSPTASCCSSGTPAELEQATGEHEALDFEGAFVALPAREGIAADGRTWAMRWLLLKDLRILRRSPLLVALLVALPAARGAARRRGAVVGPVQAEGRVREPGPPGEAKISSAASGSTPPPTPPRLFEAVDPIRVDTREEAIEKVRVGRGAGRARDPARRDRAAAEHAPLGGGAPPRSRSTTAPRTRSSAATSSRRSRATLADANKALSDEIFKEAARYLNLIVAGGTLDAAARRRVDILGLRNAQTIIDGALGRAARGRPVARRAGAGLALRPAGRRQPRRLQADPGLDRHAGARSTRGRSRVGHRRSTCSASRSRCALADVRRRCCSPPGCSRWSARSTRSAGSCAGWCRAPACWWRRSALAALCAWALASGDAGRARAFLDLGWARAPAWLLALAVAAARSRALGVAIGAPRRARSAPPRCSRSCSRCRWPPWRWCRRARSATGSTTWSASCRRLPVQAALRAGRALAAASCRRCSSRGLALGFAALARVALRRFTACGARSSTGRVHVLRRREQAASCGRDVTARGRGLDVPGRSAVRAPGAHWRMPSHDARVLGTDGSPPANTMRVGMPPLSCERVPGHPHAPPAQDRPAARRWCGRPSSRPRISSIRCSSATASTGARRSRACPASTTSRSPRPSRRPARPPRSGIPAVLLFGLPAAKDEEGSGAWDDEGVVQLATRAIKAAHPDLLVITDLCLCEYTSARPLRRAARRRRRRQRPHARAARPHRRLAGRGGRRRSSRRAT